MKRLKLLGMLAALTALLLAAVVWGSSYAPVVAPVVEIEEIWAIEDARQESERPLVTALENHGVPLAYDRDSNTFYCTIGLGHGEAWPDIHLTAPGAEDVSLVFVDDYSYDFCVDAVRDGYSYEVMAYTETEYAYFYIVFTGLTQICLESDEELSPLEQAVSVTVNAPSGTLTHYGRAHHRGASTMMFEKHPYRVEFTRTADGRSKTFAEVPGLGQMNQFILIPMWFDNSLLRDRLSWAMLGEMLPSDQPYGARRHAYVEVFVGGSYEGVYLLLEPYDHAREMAKLGAAHPASDTLYASAPLTDVPDRPSIQGAFVPGRGFALQYPAVKDDPFADLETYLAICREEDDEVFGRRMMETMDLESLIRYHLVMQGFGLGDNVFNNQFIWASHEDGGLKYRFVLWDMDMSWGEDDHIEWILEDYDGWMYFPVMDRLLSVNPDGVRAQWAAAWRQMRESVMTAENVEAKVNAYAAELNDSGAIMRNSERWGNNTSVSDPFEIINFTQMRLDIMDSTVAYIESAEGEIPMLIYDNPEAESGRIYGFDGR